MILPQSPDRVQKIPAARRVQIAGRLVQDQGLGHEGQDRGQGQPLLLTARERRRRLLPEVIQADQAQAPIRPARDLRAVHAQVLRAEGHLQRDVGREELRLEVLEDEPDAVGEIPRALGPDVLAPDPHPAGEISAHEMGDRAVQGRRQRGAARAAAAEQPHQLARP